MLELLRRILEGMAGIPDYQAYVAHRQRHHSGEPMMSREDFIRVRQQARWSGGAGRCC